ncbi:CHASE2 domain-containing protein [Natranaerofaba carboxydovora]|uniref:CHASE2 domain-containing protein n=1 Tax=Natranaerofaba carboxydovora TaxID=2742683 RepID=UPI001F12FBDD|nr:adenylate/guanylate cyclase domain-containing protein [Natranaerofaba carboxydovora]UMZ74959.1 Adenylate cyclase 2 [Natranaerofaba carboxydovora]
MSNKARLIGVLVLFLLVGFVSYFRVFGSVEGFFQDVFYQGEDGIDARIVIVGIDDPSLEELGQWPWPRDYHAELLERLDEGEPAAIGVDILFAEPSRDEEEDEILEEVLSETDNVILPNYGIFEGAAAEGEVRAEEVIDPVPGLSENALLGHINTFPDDDGIVRRALINFEAVGEDRDKVYSFAWRIYEKFLENEEPSLPEELPLDGWGRMYIDYAGPPGSFEMLSYNRVLEGEIPPEYFEDKIVLIGPYTVGIDDYYFTPMARNSPMFGVEVHANILQQMLRQDFKEEASYGVELVALALVGALGYVAFSKLSPYKALGALVVLVGGYIAGARYVYDSGLIVFLFYPVLFLVVMYVGTLAHGYLDEILERRRVTGAFGRYVSPEVVDEILAEGEEGLKLGGVRREVTLLFVDIRGFTPLSESAEPEEVVDILNDYLGLCAEAVFNHGGTLDKFMGDAVMAIFSAPLEVEDHALKAVKAAREMVQGSKELQKELEKKHGKSVELGVGINTGFAVVGNIGADFRMDYTAIGDTVNTAARLESDAAPSQILISDFTYQQVKDKVETRNLGSIKVKGKSQEVSVYEVTRILEEE